MEKIPAGSEHVAVTEEMPSGVERRMVLRLLTRWRPISGDKRLPSFTDVGLSEFPDIRPHRGALNFFGDGLATIGLATGNQLAGHGETSLTDRLLSELPTATLPGIAFSYLEEMLEKGAPVSHGGKFIRSDGTKLHHQSILLTMRDDGENIGGILGAANLPVISGEGTAEYRQAEI